MYKRKVARLFKRNSLAKFILLFLFLIVCCILLIVKVEATFKPTIQLLAQTQANWTATEAIHQAVLDEIVSDIRYSDLIIPHKDKDDRVIFMQADIIMVNKLASEAVIKIQKRLEEMRRESFYVPLGQITGVKLFASYGPKIKFNLLPVGTVRVEISDDFTEAGINQTRHRIYLNVISDMKVAFPLIAADLNIQAQVPIADSIIVGPVPETYLSFGTGAQVELSKLSKL